MPAGEAARTSPTPAYRWTVLLAVSLTMAANYYIYDSINPLERIFIQQLDFTATTFGLLNSAYAASAIATLLLGGILIDRIGTQRAIPCFAVIVCLGAGLTAASGHPATMIAGRALLGLGGEALVVAATTVIAQWFKGKELSFAFGIKVTIARLASVASDNSPVWADRIFYPSGAGAAASCQGPLLLAAGAGLFAVLCSGIYWALEQHADRPRPVAAASRRQPSGGWRQSLRFNLSYWYVVGVCLTFYSAIFPFRTFAIDFFTNRILAGNGGMTDTEAAHILAHQQASMFASLLPLSAMIATPLLGLLSDRIGRRASLMMIAAVLLVPVYVLMGYTNVSLLVPLSMMGVAFAVIPAVMWPSVAYLVPPSRLGTAYALMTLIEQLGFFALNLIIGRANDYQLAGPGNLEGYRLGLLICSALALSGFVFTLLLRARERGPHSHGLETLTAAGSRRQPG
jgi:MFS family permease